MRKAEAIVIAKSLGDGLDRFIGGIKQNLGEIHASSDQVIDWWTTDTAPEGATQVGFGATDMRGDVSQTHITLEIDIDEVLGLDHHFWPIGNGLNARMELGYDFMYDLTRTQLEFGIAAFEREQIAKWLRDCRARENIDIF